MTALFDGSCGVCLVVVSWLEDRTPGVRYAAYQTFSDDELGQMGLNADACSEALHLIDAPCILRGAPAINELLRISRHPLRFVAAAVDRLSILGWIEDRTYRVFAARRHVASRFLGLNECPVRMHPSARD